MTHFKKSSYLIPTLILGLCFIECCTFVKMGSLFLSGDIHQKGFTRSVDFEYIGNLVFIKVKINNVPQDYRFLFDNGASFNVISTRIAQNIGFESVVEDTIKDAAKKTDKVKFCKIPRLTIAGIPFIDTAAAIMDLNQNTWLECYGIDGVVGMNLIRLVNKWQIDYQSKKITFSDQSVLVDPSAKKRVITFDQNIQRIPEIDLYLHDQLKVKCTIDLGSTSAFSLDIKTWEKLEKIKPDIRYISRTGELGGGALGTQTGTIFLAVFDNLKAGETPLGSYWIRFEPSVFNSVGNRFWQNYVITFNWEEKTLTLTDSVATKEDVEFPSYGFGYGYDTGTRNLYINFLYEPSPAEKSGLKIQDKIMSINGLNLEGIQPDDYCRFLLQPETLLGKGNRIEMVIERSGQIQTFDLEKEDLFAELRK